MKSYFKRLSLVAAALTIVGVVAIPATLHGDDWNLKTYITVSQPFQVPGKVLEPDTKYVLKRLDGNAARTVVQVFNEDQSKLLAMFMAIPDYRLEPTDNTVLTFMETERGYPKPVQTWFYPGRLDGLEFLYSKQQKQEIAMHEGKGNQSHITETAMLNSGETPATENVAPQKSTSTSEYRQNEATLDETNEADIQRSKPTDTNLAADVDTNADNSAMDTTPSPEPTDNESTASNEESLPKTAGELPLLGLIGLACLGLRFVLRLV